MSRPLSDPVFKPYVLSHTAIPVLAFLTPSLTNKMSTKSSFTTPPPAVHDSLISFPTPQILQVTLNRPTALNCINTRGHYELDALYTWFDNEPSLRCAILTGAGRAFCAGADLKEWDNANHSSSTQDGKSGLSREASERTMPPSGFGALSRRGGKKPIICAVNGICFGGGCEMIINADMVVADEGAQFGLPEAKIGVVALAGALSRLVRTVGRQRAMEMALTGRPLKAEEAREWGLVNRVVPKGKCVEEAIKLAEMIVGNSPDSVIVSREGVKMGWEGIGAEEATRWTQEVWYKRMDKGENMKEGVRSFVEKRKPRWVPSKL
ncbi:ClpP/crotonase [Hyaloscypha variabilis F]|uniref:ClpP/crotonase n=1 Tax=Hyaloscypha variabilis (strain UAMH 11265 / GT02V1 / F) TaxID=1149755 RepID=A0A2J6S8A2_HYAVF|nr:ClpP/crotonase [Hyaloscypha variabilis F]